MLRAIIFDFDGTIIDTEGPVFHGWAKTFSDMGCELSLQDYSRCIADDRKREILRAMLEERVRGPGRAVHWERLDRERGQFYRPLVERQPILAGVMELLLASREAGVRAAVCSNSPREWVAGHLERLNIAHLFDTIVCREDAPEAKPHPDLYHETLRRLDVEARHAVAIEDSPNGTKGARAAGIFCVTVPNPCTAQLTFEELDLRIDSLSGVSCDHLHLHLSKRNGDF
ncbi:MAG TPA: HAD-IA family hydrolase [bacterium]|nr:HAD-IA family hydrolase [bacterium]